MPPHNLVPPPLLPFPFSPNNFPSVRPFGFNYFGTIHPPFTAPLNPNHAQTTSDKNMAAKDEAKTPMEENLDEKEKAQSESEIPTPNNVPSSTPTQ